MKHLLETEHSTSEAIGNLHEELATHNRRFYANRISDDMGAGDLLCWILSGQILGRDTGTMESAKWGDLSNMCSSGHYRGVLIGVFNLRLEYIIWLALFLGGLMRQVAKPL